MNETTFKQLSTGDKFYMDRNPETGLLADLGKPGRREYVKLSARTYKNADGDTLRVGSINVRVWVEQ